MGWTQAELARRAGVRPETLNRIEQGKHSASVPTIDKLDRALMAGEAKAKRKRPSTFPRLTIDDKTYGSSGGSARPMAQAADESAPLPAWPPADEQGRRPVLAFSRVSIARSIMEERRAAGLTQEKLAQLAGVRQETICRLESGKHSPTLTAG